VALTYRVRGAVALFFRWLTWVVGCHHLLSQRVNGVQIRVSVAIIASLLLSVWVGRRRTVLGEAAGGGVVGSGEGGIPHIRIPE
jgi:hypothetical protein